MILKSTAVLAALILRVALGCRENLCNSCKCSGRKITCSDARFAQQAFHCDFTDYHVLSKTPVVIPWRSLSLEDVDTTSNITIDLRNAPLNCSSCENAWLMQWRTIETTTLRGLEDCAYCPQLSVFAWLNLPRIVFGYNNNMRCDGEKLMKKCAIPDVAEHKPLQFTELHEGESEAMWTCSSVYPKQNTSFAGCLSAIFRPIPLPGSATNSNDHKIVPTKFGDESGECVTEYELQRTPELNVTHSGFFGCSIRKGFIPAVEWRFVLFKGIPHFLNWTMKKDKDIYIHAKIISATDFKVYLLYTPNDIIKHPTEFELMYQILPSDDSHIRETTKFEMSNVEEPFTMDYNKSITIGIRRRAVTLEFHDIKVTCDSFGVYYLIAKNAHGFNYRRFAITDIPFGLGCKAPEEKFHVIKEHNITLADFGYNDAVNQTKIPTMFANMVDDGTVSGLGGSPVPPPEETVATNVVIIINVVVIAFGAVVCLVLKKVMDKRTKQRAEQVSSSYHMDLLNPLLVQNPTYFDWMHSVQARTDIHVITSDDLEIVREIGQGAFGQVHLVRRMQPSTMLSNENDHLLAMKQLKYVSPEKLVDLEHEASVLTKLSHPNIVKFYGITLIDGAFGLLFEYMSEGDLVTYLRNRSQDLQGTEPVPYSDMLRMSIQVASGLEYLHSHHMVHRDVAARNCLVATELIVKLSDFGMTRDVYVTDYYKMDSHTLVPLRWLPPESIVYRKFTVESDMWSFGVLLWEIFSGGQVPWYMYSNTEVLEIVKNGELLAKPDCCPETVYKTLMLRCWASKPSERISATNIKEKLTELLDSTSVYCSLTMDRSASLQQEYQNLTTLPTSNRHRSA